MFPWSSGEPISMMQLVVHHPGLISVLYEEWQGDEVISSELDECESNHCKSEA